MRNLHPVVQSYYVAILRDETFIRCCVPVSRKAILAKSMKIEHFVNNALTIACNVARDEYATVLAYCPVDDSYYPLFNYNPFVKFISTPKR